MLDDTKKTGLAIILHLFALTAVSGLFSNIGGFLDVINNVLFTTVLIDLAVLIINNEKMLVSFGALHMYLIITLCESYSSAYTLLRRIQRCIKGWMNKGWPPSRPTTRLGPFLCMVGPSFKKKNLSRRKKHKRPARHKKNALIVLFFPDQCPKMPESYKPLVPLHAPTCISLQ